MIPAGAMPTKMFARGCPTHQAAAAPMMPSAGGQDLGRMIAITEIATMMTGIALIHPVATPRSSTLSPVSAAATVVPGPRRAPGYGDESEESGGSLIAAAVHPRRSKNGHSDR